MVDGLPVCQALLTGSNLGSDRGEQAFEHRKRIDSVHLWCTFYVHSQVQLKDTDTDQRVDLLVDRTNINQLIIKDAVNSVGS